MQSRTLCFGSTVGTPARGALHAIALATLSLTLTACGGGSDAPPPPAGPTFVVKGSTSRTATAFAPTWRERLVAWLAPRPAQAQSTPATAGSPTFMQMRFHALLITPNADCSGPYTTVQTHTPPREVDLVTNPSLFEGSPPAGTYRCVIFEADDVMVIRPDAAAQTAFPERCIVGRTYETDLYRAPDNDYRRPDGAPISAAGTRAAPSSQRVFFFATTDRAAATARTGGPSINQTLPLASPLVVPTQTTLYVDATNGLLGGVEDGVGYCVVESVVIGFR